MSTLPRPYRFLAVFALLALAALPTRPVQANDPATGTAAAAPAAGPGAGDGIRINEVMPKPEGGGFEWVELYNGGFYHLYLPLVLRSFPGEAAAAAPSGRAPAGAGTTAGPVDISGWQVTDEDDNNYTIPDALPAVPPGAYVLILFDGQGPGADDYDVSDGLATLHSPAGMVDILEDEADQVGLYSSSTHSPDTIADFVAYGESPGEDGANAVAAAQWPMEGYVATAQAPGGVGLEPGGSLGLRFQDSTGIPGEWVIVTARETTPGHRNAVPGPHFFNPPNGISACDHQTTFGWDGRDAASFHFELDDDPAFASPELSVDTAETTYQPLGPLPDGAYYYRVKALDPDGRESSYSDTSQATFIDCSGAARGAAAAAEVLLNVTPLLQHKDTHMLNFDGDPETGVGRWDSAHESDGDWIVGNGDPVRVTPLDNHYCTRASMAMIVAYHGGQLSQDRIAYQGFGEGPAWFDLGYNTGMWPNQQSTWGTGKNVFDWAMNGAVTSSRGKPSFDQVKGWIDNNRPVLIVENSDTHSVVLDGYQDLPRVKLAHRVDPWTGTSDWVSWNTWSVSEYHVAPAGITPRSDEDEDGDGTADTVDDSDGDEVCDFDERIRFAESFDDLDPADPDTDGDGVPDKLDMREYLFDDDGHPKVGDMDMDRDGLHKQVDPDNDNGGSLDGCEDANHNGKYEPALDETSNFDPAEEKPCSCEEFASVQNWTGQVDFSFTTSASSGEESVSINHSATVNLLMVPDYQNSSYVAWQDASLGGTGEVNDTHTDSPSEEMVGSGDQYPGGPGQDDPGANFGLWLSGCTFEFYLKTGMPAVHTIHWPDGDEVFSDPTWVGLMDINDIPVGQLSGTRSVPAVYYPSDEDSWYVPGSAFDGELEWIVGHYFGQATVSWSFAPAD